MSESQSEAPWDRWPRESQDAYRRFLHFRDGDRQLKSTAMAFALAPSTVHEQSRRFRWLERCRAWDAAKVCAVDGADAQSFNLMSSRRPNYESDPKVHVEAAREHAAILEHFRQECEAAGRSTMKLARGITACATRSTARLLREDVKLSPREIAALASVSSQLAAAGQAQWARAIAVDQMLSQLQGIISVAMED